MCDRGSTRGMERVSRPCRGSRLRRCHRHVLSAVMGRPCGRALPLFYDVHDQRCRNLLLCALPPGDTIYGIVWKAYQCRARVIVLCCLEGVAAQGGWYLTNPVIHRALFVLRFHHRGWFPAMGWYISIRGIATVSYTHLTLPTSTLCRSRWSPYH